MLANLIIASLFVLISLGLALNLEKITRFSVAIGRGLAHFTLQFRLFLETMGRAYQRYRRLSNKTYL